MRFAFEYFKWHYGEGVASLVNIIGNFVWFFYEFFSIPLLLKTYFMPFHRLNEAYRKGFNIESWFETLVVNIMMRFVGALLRTVLITLGIFFILLTIGIGVCFFVAWLLAPFLLFFLISYGIKLVSIP